MSNWYRDGTVTMVGGSDLVNGVGTDWIDNALPGGIFFSPDGLYEVLAVVSSTRLQLSKAYAGESVAGAEYAIAPTQAAVVSATKAIVNFNASLGSLYAQWQAGELNGKGLALKGVRDTVEDLPESGNTIGDGYLIDAELWVYTGNVGAPWYNAGSMVTSPELEGLRDDAVNAKSAAEQARDDTEATRIAYEDRVYPGVYNSSSLPTLKPHSGLPSAEGDKCSVLVDLGSGLQAVEHLRSGGGWVIPNIDSAAFASSGGAFRIGFQAEGLEAIVYDVGRKLRDFLTIDDFRRPEDFDDSDALDRAIAAAIEFNISRVLAMRKLYNYSRRADLGGAKKLVIEGAGGDATRFFVNGIDAPVQSLFWASTDAGQLTFKNFTVAGTAIDDVTGPRRSRSFSGPGLNSAFIFEGDARPGTVGRPRIEDISLEGVRVEGCHGLPWLLDGVRGYARALNCETYNTMDAGWIFCDLAQGRNLLSRKSSDNGFSASRGNRMIDFSGIYAEDCAYFALWIAGFPTPGAINSNDVGPKRFNVVNVSGVRVGRGVLALIDAPKWGTIMGVYGDTGFRGPSDQPSNIYGMGIYVSGFPSDNLPAPTDYAEYLTIIGFVLKDFPRGGVGVTGARHVHLRGGTIINPGTKYRADGVTEILSTDLEQNFGVSVFPGAQGTVSHLKVEGVHIIDDRVNAVSGLPEPYTNQPIYVTGSVSPEVSGCSAIGTRVALTFNDNRDQINSGTTLWTKLQRLIAAAVTGSNTSTGVVLGIANNGTATSTRVISELQSAGIAVWRRQSDTSGDSNVQEVTRNNDGSFRKLIYTLFRNTGVWKWQSATADSGVYTTVAADGPVVVDADTVNVASFALNGSVTAVTVNGGYEDQSLIIVFIGAAGGKTHAWPANARFQGGASPNAVLLSGRSTSVRFIRRGGFWYEAGRAVDVGPPV